MSKDKLNSKEIDIAILNVNEYAQILYNKIPKILFQYSRVNPSDDWMKITGPVDLKSLNAKVEGISSLMKLLGIQDNWKLKPRLKKAFDEMSSVRKDRINFAHPKVFDINKESFKEALLRSAKSDIILIFSSLI